MIDAPQVSIIIINWNVRDLLKANLARLFSPLLFKEGVGEDIAEVIVVDNGSADGSVVMIKADFPKVHLIRNESNRGFAYAVNQALRVAKGEVMVLFNPDMLMGDGAIEHAYQTLTRQKDIGVLGVKLAREDGSIVESVRRDPGFGDQLAILLKVPHLLPKVLDRYLMKDFDYAKSQNVDQLRGSFFAFRRDVYEKIGSFDANNFFIWFEEVDFCKRVREAGLRVWYSADVACIDLVGRSFHQRTARWKQYHLSRSMTRYFKKWMPWWQTAALYALRPVAILFGVVVDLVGAKSKLWK